VLRTLFIDGISANPAVLRPKYKRPVDFITSALRGLDGETNGGRPLQQFLSQMGQPLFEWPTPDGAPDSQEAWMGNLMPRWKLALSLARNEVPGTEIEFRKLLAGVEDHSPTTILSHLTERLVGLPLDAQTSQGLIDAVLFENEQLDNQAPAILTAGLIASPAFQWR
jgi:uncharacterized protein (DUF1800 family)